MARKRRKPPGSKPQTQKPVVAINVSRGRPANVVVPRSPVPITAHPEPSPTPLTIPIHQRLWRATRWAVGTALAALGLVATLSEILGGPLWPVSPDFQAGYPSAESPFSIPFTVKNKSGVFSMNKMEIRCGIDIETNVGSFFRNFSIGSLETSELPALQSRPDKCKFDKAFRFDPPQSIRRARISFVGQYETIWPWGTFKFDSGEFNLDTTTSPAQWTHGKPLP